MNSVNSDIFIDGLSVKLPTTTGNEPALSSSLTFEKPSWLLDEEASSCLNCGLTFTHFRRKHHCRNCGKIFCSKCCPEKISLPHFGMNQPEKVCTNCKLIVELMVKSKSQEMEHKYEAVLGLSSLLKSAAGLSKVVECGGVHMMLSLASNGDNRLKSAVASALHNIAQNMMLNSFLVEAGCLKVLKHFLKCCLDYSELLNDSLSTLNLLCMDSNIRVEVLKEGIVDSLLDTIGSHSGIPSVFACRVLQLLVCNFDYHEFILQKHPKTIPDLFEALQCEDFQMHGCISKMLMYLSAGSTTFREIMIQEDITRDFPLLLMLKGTSHGVLINIACIVANLSLAVDRSFAHHYITGMCDLLISTNDENEELLTQIGRGLANFAEFPSNALHMIHYLPIIISRLLKSTLEVPRVHSCRILIYLFSTELPCALNCLSQSGVEEFIGTVFDLPGITDILNNLFLRKVSRLSVCKQ